VREIWDGNRVVRQAGESNTIELFHVDNEVGFHVKPLRDVALGHRRRDRQLSELEERQMFGGEDIGAPERAPNLTLNFPKAVPRVWETAACLGLGIAIQSTVIAINAFAVYHWRWLRAGKIVDFYGYPIWAAGTGAITLGSLICGRIVESSAVKYALDYDIPNGRIIRLQRKIPTLHIPSYGIYGESTTRPVRMSLRKWPPIEGDTVLGAFFALGGFVCQNIGTR
jgi:hypothetical protein